MTNVCCSPQRVDYGYGLLLLERMSHCPPSLLFSGLSFTRWAVEVLSIEAYSAASLPLRPVGLHTLSQHGYCGLHRIVYWDTGAYLSKDDAASLLALVQEGSSMCSTYVGHDLVALVVQTFILCFVAAACQSVQVYLTRQAASGSFSHNT